MLNKQVKNEAQNTLANECQKYKNVYDDAMEKSLALYKKRRESVDLMKNVENFINCIANTPKELQKKIGTIQINRKKFENDVTELEDKGADNDHMGAGIVGTGAAIGASVAAFGPSIAMAVATTFGTASTGTAIATLSGAAATNAALAWLGGGVIMTGGAGMAGGSAFLALAGPVGWAIGGATLIGSGVFMNSKNKKIAEEATEKAIKIKKESALLRKLIYKIETIKKEIEELYEGVEGLLKKTCGYRTYNYSQFSNEQKEKLTKLINMTESLSCKLMEKVD